MPQRIDLGRALLALGAALLVISLFLDWYDTSFAEDGALSGWRVFESVDLLLIGLAAAAVGLAGWTDRFPAWAVWAVPAATIFVVLVQLIDPPPVVGGADPAVGGWLALGAGVIMAAGSVLSQAAVSVTVQLRERETRRRVPAVDRREEGEAVPPDTEERKAVSLFQEPGDEQRTQPLTAVPRDEEDGPTPPPPGTGPT